MEDAEDVCFKACNQGVFMPPIAQPVEVPCEEAAPGPSCGAWDPDAEITPFGGVRYVDAAWFDGLVNAPWPVWTCDAAYLSPLSGGGFEVNTASADELLYELGLRNDDIPLELNDMPLDDYEDVDAAFLQLYLIEGETAYDLEVLRGVNVVHLLYVLS